MSEIKVKVTKFSDRKFWLMYYDCPLSGKRLTRSIRQTNERDAQKEAGKWEDQLNEGRYKRKTNVTWAEFREEFLQEHLADAPKKTFAAYATALNAVERHCKVNRLAELTSERITFLAKKLRKPPPNGDGLSPETVRSYLTHLRAALNWAASPEIGMLREAPVATIPKRVKGEKIMKGRAITSEEFERMLSKVVAGLVAANISRPESGQKRQLPEDVLKRRREQTTKDAQCVAPSWHQFLRGLWWSGLRLGEAITLSWDDERYITVDVSGPHPRLRIKVGQDKSQEARLLPLAPEFAEMLLAIPVAKRSGSVFPLPGLSGSIVTDVNYVSRIVSAIGEATGVKVDPSSGKFASSHDFRRAFGVRWATRVMPAVLKELMRHADISTTMKYYAGQDVAAMEDATYAAFGRVNTFVNSRSDMAPVKTTEKSEPIAAKQLN